MLTERELLDARRDARREFGTATGIVSRLSEFRDGAGGTEIRRLSGGIYRLSVTPSGGGYSIRLYGDAHISPSEYDVEASDEVVVGDRRYRIESTDRGETDALCLTCLCALDTDREPEKP